VLIEKISDGRRVALVHGGDGVRNVPLSPRTMLRER
jgi:hypothetical protein